MARKNRSERELVWRDILNRQAESGLSVRKFCARERVSEPSFYTWRKRLSQPSEDGSRSRKLNDRVDATEDERLFVPLTLRGTHQMLEIVHPLGYRVQVTGEVDTAALRQVFEVLDGRGR